MGFKVGDKVSFQGALGIVDGFRSSPGMVDLRMLDSGLVTRRHESQLVKVGEARQNPYRGGSHRGNRGNSLKSRDPGSHKQNSVSNFDYIHALVNGTLPPEVEEYLHRAAYLKLSYAYDDADREADRVGTDNSRLRRDMEQMQAQGLSTDQMLAEIQKRLDAWEVKVASREAHFRAEAAAKVEERRRAREEEAASIRSGPLSAYDVLAGKKALTSQKREEIPRLLPLSSPEEQAKQAAITALAEQAKLATTDEERDAIIAQLEAFKPQISFEQQLEQRARSRDKDEQESAKKRTVDRPLSGKEIRREESIDIKLQVRNAVFFTQADPPRLAADARSYCGNPIDGTAYYFVVGGKPKTTTTWLKREDVIRKARKALDIKPDVELTEEQLMEFFDKTMRAELEADGRFSLVERVFGVGQLMRTKQKHARPLQMELIVPKSDSPGEKVVTNYPDEKVDFAYGQDKEKTFFLKVSVKNPGRDALKHFDPFGSYYLRAPEKALISNEEAAQFGSFVMAVARSSKEHRLLGPKGIPPDLALALVTGGCVRLSGDVVTAPNYDYWKEKESIRITFPAKGRSEFFSWKPTLVPLGALQLARETAKRHSREAQVTDIAPCLTAQELEERKYINQFAGVLRQFDGALWRIRSVFANLFSPERGEEKSLSFAGIGGKSTVYNAMRRLSVAQARAVRWLADLNAKSNSGDRAAQEVVRWLLVDIVAPGAPFTIALTTFQDGVLGDASNVLRYRNMPGLITGGWTQFQASDEKVFKSEVRKQRRNGNEVVVISAPEFQYAVRTPAALTEPTLTDDVVGSGPQKLQEFFDKTLTEYIQKGVYAAPQVVVPTELLGAEGKRDAVLRVEKRLPGASALDFLNGKLVFPLKDLFDYVSPSLDEATLATLIKLQDSAPEAFSELVGQYASGGVSGKDPILVRRADRARKAEHQIRELQDKVAFVEVQLEDLGKRETYGGERPHSPLGIPFRVISKEETLQKLKMAIGQAEVELQQAENAVSENKRALNLVKRRGDRKEMCLAYERALQEARSSRLGAQSVLQEAEDALKSFERRSSKSETEVGGEVVSIEKKLKASKLREELKKLQEKLDKAIADSHKVSSDEDLQLYMPTPPGWPPHISSARQADLNWAISLLINTVYPALRQEVSKGIDDEFADAKAREMVKNLLFLARVYDFYEGFRLMGPLNPNAPSIESPLLRQAMDAIRKREAQVLGGEKGISSADSYSTFITYNPVLFELTRLFWPSKAAKGERSEAASKVVSEVGEERPMISTWGSILNHAEAMFQVDAVGRFGAGAQYTQAAAAVATSEADVSNRLKMMLYPGFAAIQPTEAGRSYSHDGLNDMMQGKILDMRDQVLIQAKPGTFDAFLQGWPLGMHIVHASLLLKEWVDAPLTYLQKLKVEMARAIPWVLKTGRVAKTASPLTESQALFGRAKYKGHKDREWSYEPGKGKVKQGAVRAAKKDGSQIRGSSLYEAEQQGDTELRALLSDIDRALLEIDMTGKRAKS